MCQHFGIDTSDYSFAYVASWGSGKELPELKASLETIRATANDIINKLEDILLGRQKEHVQDKAPNQEKSEAVSLPKEKEKATMAHIESLENQRILQIVDTYRLNGDDLKRKLAAIMPANAPKTNSGISISDNERNNENEKNN